ncbi:MAG TPA: hypothetical protein DEB39_05770 [Planctomycetaceae bacterium]|nr:hypothetical protein [Planctomycetaceae bacterium]
MTRSFLSTVLLSTVCFSPVVPFCVAADEPRAINPFGKATAKPESERDGVLPGYIEMSDGEIHPGFVYLTRDIRLSMYDKEYERKRQIPLDRIVSLEAVVKKEWMEREWRFKELASNEKLYTGREYPVRMVDYKATFHDGKTLTAPLAALFFLQPLEEGDDVSTGYKPDVDPIRFNVYDRQGKADTHNGMKLADVLYVKSIHLGEEAFAEGIDKAALHKKKPNQAKKSPDAGKSPQPRQSPTATTGEPRERESDGNSSE